MPRLRVLEICESTRSGVGVSFATYIDALLEAGCEVEVICSILRDGRFQTVVDTLRRRGVRVHVWPMARAVRPWSDGRIVRALVRLMRQRPFDVVHTHGSKAGVVGRLAARWCRVPRILHTPHCFAFMNQSHLALARWLYERLERWLARQTDTLIAVSPSQAQDWLRRRVVTTAQLITIPNGIPAAPFTDNHFDRERGRALCGLPPRGALIGSVGVLEPSKGYAYLMRAFAELVQQHPAREAHLVLIGDGPLAGTLAQLAGRLGCGARVHFLGYRTDVPDLLKCLDVFVLPSLWEGLSLALLEALATGVPVIATAVHGTRDCVRPGETGWLVPPRDVTALTRAMTEVLADPLRGWRCGRHAQTLIETQYDIQLQKRQFIALITGRTHALQPVSAAANAEILTCVDAPSPANDALSELPS